MNGGGAGLPLFFYLKQGGVAMYPLLLCSVLNVAIAAERIWVLFRAGRLDAALLEPLRGLLGSKQATDAAAQCAKQDSPLARVVQATLAANPATPNHREKLLQRALARETSRLEQYLPVLATIGSVAPFIGLFGTVLGIMRSFRDIATAGAAGGAVVAAGVAEALVTTAAGLFVAVIAVVAYNHLMTWAQSVITNTELNAEELVALMGE